MCSGSTNDTVSPDTLPSFKSVSRFVSVSSTFALPVTVAPSCFSVKVYFCRPRCVSKSAFQVPVTSAARMDNGNANKVRSAIEVFMLFQLGGEYRGPAKCAGSCPNGLWLLLANGVACTAMIMVSQTRRISGHFIATSVGPEYDEYHT